MDAHRQKVHGIFSRIAGKYDLMNTILSFNLDKQWRSRTLAVATPIPKEQWLDVCCGTGKLTLEIRRLLGTEGEVTGLDFTAAMLAVARQTEANAALPAQINWLEADALSLPFADSCFDGVTIGFGLRGILRLHSGKRRGCASGSGCAAY